MLKTLSEVLIHCVLCRTGKFSFLCGICYPFCATLARNAPSCCILYCMQPPLPCSYQLRYTAANRMPHLRQEAWQLVSVCVIPCLLNSEEHQLQLFQLAVTTDQRSMYAWQEKMSLAKMQMEKRPGGHRSHIYKAHIAGNQRR